MPIHSPQPTQTMSAVNAAWVESSISAPQVQAKESTGSDPARALEPSRCSGFTEALRPGRRRNVIPRIRLP